MLVLAFDTATPAVTVAVLDDDQALAERCAAAPNRHGELLAPLIAASLDAAGLTAGDLDRIVVGVGPGPFTGLRVGVVTALTLGDALGVPVHGICSLDALAADRGDVVAVTDARRREVYWARYLDGALVAGPTVEQPAALAARLRAEMAPPLLVGPGAQLYADQFEDLPSQPLGQVVAAVLGRLASAGRGPRPPIPLYLRRPDAVPAPIRRAVS